METIIFTDGSCVFPSDIEDAAPNDDWPCLTNGAPAGYGGWAWWISDDLHAAGAVTHATSLRMEIQAIIEALRAGQYLLDHPITIATDCLDIVTAMTKSAATRYARWAWLPASSDQAGDLDYWDDLADLVIARTAPTTWVKIKAHSGVDGNAHADRLARAKARHLARLGGLLPADGLGDPLSLSVDPVNL